MNSFDEYLFSNTLLLYFLTIAITLFVMVAISALFTPKAVPTIATVILAVPLSVLIAAISVYAMMIAYSPNALSATISDPVGALAFTLETGGGFIGLTSLPFTVIAFLLVQKSRSKPARNSLPTKSAFENLNRP